jgi:hypothetical protein
LFIDNYLYLANDYAGLKIYDLSDLSVPLLLTELKLNNGLFTRLRDFRIVEDEGTTLLYSTLYKGGLAIIDVTDPKNSSIVSILKTPGAAGSILAANQQEIMFLEDNSRLTKVNVTSKHAPQMISSLPLGFVAQVAQKNSNYYYLMDNEASYRLKAN